ncbi:MAG: transcription termination factor NusA [Mycoplasmatales bacterium]
MTKNQKIFAGIDQLVEKKGLDKEIIVEGLTDSIALTMKKTHGIDNVVVNINCDTKRITMHGFKTVVEHVIEPTLEISLEDALEHSKTAKIGKDVKIKLKLERDTFERAIVIGAKQVFRQKLKEAEYKKMLEMYGDKVGKVVTGKLEEIKENYAYFKLDDTDTLAVLKETFREGEAPDPDVPIKLVIDSILPQSTKGVQIRVSRSANIFVEEILSRFIPEIENGDIIINGIGREAGNRTKVAVSPADEDSDLDIVGACVGPNGSRVHQINEALSGENVDFIEYCGEIRLFISNALQPALVIAIQIIDQENKKVLAVVPDDQYSLAIGSGGLNVKLASRLTRWGIDIKSETMAQEEGIDYEDDVI